MIKIAYHSCYAHPLPEGHRFPMIKYELIPQQLMYQGLITADQLTAPNCCSLDDVLRTHEANYINQLMRLNLDKAHIRRIGFPLSEALVERELRIVQGTIDCCLNALKNGISLNISGGTHHAFSNRGEGFCLLNDMAIAANFLLHHQLAKRILIIDLDVHQGNGTAEIFSRVPQVFTFSMHGKNNFPFFKEISSLDIELEDGTDGTTYLRILKNELNSISRRFKPDFVFYNSGVDILNTDKLGKLNVSIVECSERDEVVFSFCKNLEVPVVVAMGGGYSPKLSDIVDAHCNTFKQALNFF